MSTTPTRLERRREATYVALVAAALELLAEGSELSLRAVASRMGVTGPALYRYVAHYRQLVDLVAFEIDRGAADRIRAAVETLPGDDAAGRLALAATELRCWALGNPREFGLVFANPFASVGTGEESPAGSRRESVTVTSTGRLFADLFHRLWRVTGFAVPSLDDLSPAAREAVLDPVLPGHADALATQDRGLVYVSLQAWTRLYGVVALEVFGHVDPRLVSSGELFLDVLREQAPVFGVGAEMGRLEVLVRARLRA